MTFMTLCHSVVLYHTDSCLRWHPEVGRAPPPNLQQVTGRTKHYNTKYKPRSPRRYSSHFTTSSHYLSIDFRRVEIFNDKDYLKEMRESRGRRKRRKRKDDDNSRTEDPDPDRPRSLGRWLCSLSDSVTGSFSSQSCRRWTRSPGGTRGLSAGGGATGLTGGRVKTR